MARFLFFFVFFFAEISYASSPQPIQFDHACDPGESSIVIGAVGDMVPYLPLQRQAQASPIGFRSLWKGIEDLLVQADLTYANLEGPVAKGYPTGGYPSFNYDVRLIDDLKAGGIDIVSTANNHALDRESSGLNQTIRNLLERGLLFFGTRATPEFSKQLEKDLGYRRAWHAVSETKGIRIAWVGCTYGLNEEGDFQSQVLNCHSDRSFLLKQVRDLSVRPEIDAVFVTPHWGIQYEHQPRERERRLAQAFLEAGALAVLGTHPHVLQPVEKHHIGGRETFIAYSLGDFLSGNRARARRTGSILYFGLTKGKEGRAWLNGVRYIPVHLVEESGLFTLEAMARVAPPEASRAIIQEVYHPWNEHAPDGPVVSNPECFPDQIKATP